MRVVRISDIIAYASVIVIAINIIVLLFVATTQLPPPPPPPSQGFPVSALVGIGVGGALVVIIPLAVIVRRRKSRETETRKASVLRQTASLAQLIVVHLASGRSLFSRTIGSEEGADPNLISGFLSANQTLISEVFKKQTGAGLKFADYGDYKVISDLGKHVMVTLFATETAGKELKGVLQSFTKKFENKYGKALGSWDGDMSTFKDADALADEVFCLPLTAPYVIAKEVASKIRLSGIEMRVLREAAKLSAGRGVFFMPRIIDYLLTREKVKRSKTVDILGSLEKKGIFKQLTVDEAAKVIKNLPAIREKVSGRKHSSLEGVAFDVFQRSGFNVRRVVRFLGKSGITHEVDLVAEKGDQVFIVEVKDLTVASPDIDAFVAKVLDLPEVAPRTYPVIVSRGFTSIAARVAKEEGVKLFDMETLSSLEKLIINRLDRSLV